MRAEATTDILGRRMRRATGLLILARVALVLGLASRSRAPAAALAHSIVSIYLHGRGCLDGRHGADPSDADQCHSAPARWGLGASALPPFSTPSHAARRALTVLSNNWLFQPGRPDLVDRSCRSHPDWKRRTIVEFPKNMKV